MQLFDHPPAHDESGFESDISWAYGIALSEARAVVETEGGYTLCQGPGTMASSRGPIAGWWWEVTFNATPDKWFELVTVSFLLAYCAPQDETRLRFAVRQRMTACVARFKGV